MVNQLALAPNTRYLQFVFDPSLMMEARGAFTTPASGVPYHLPNIQLRPPFLGDFSQDVILDPGEPSFSGTTPSGLTYQEAFTLGTDPTKEEVLPEASPGCGSGFKFTATASVPPSGLT